MAENDTPTPPENEPSGGPADETIANPEVTPVPAAAEAATPPAEPRQRFTDRVWNLRAMVAVALAALLLGGGLGAAITALSNEDDERHPGFGRFGDGPAGRPGELGGPGWYGPEQRRQFRQDLKDMRERMRDQMREQLEEQEDEPNG